MERHDNQKSIDQTTDGLVQAQFSRRQFLKYVAVAGAAVGVGAGVPAVLSGCGGGTTTTTAAASATTASSAVSSATTAAGGGAGAGGTIKIGYLTDFAIPPNVNSRKVLEAIVAGANNRGGWDVGGGTHQLELISYDTKSDPNTARSAVERLVGEDKVDVVLGDATASAWATVTEGAKTIAMIETALPDIYKPEYKYVFGASMQPLQTPAYLGYLPQYLSKEIKKYAVVYSEDPIGQVMSADVQMGLATLGESEAEMISFPSNTTDFTAVATKILASGADGVIFNVSNQAMAQIIRALQGAGYTGATIMLHELAPGEVSKMIPLDQLEGLIGGIATWSTDNPVPVAQELKDDYIAQYGQWDDPGFTDLDVFYTYRAAVQAAGSKDADAVAGALAGGLAFQGPHGNAKMIARPDAGVPDRTVCAVMDMTMCTIKGGKVDNVQTEGLADVEKFAATIWGAPKPQ